MVESKNYKSKPYFKRFQVKYRRRREGKTDYKSRKNLIRQQKNKYNTPKYRLVVRISNKDVICQIVSSTIAGDIVHSVAYSHELPRYGLKVGLKNFASSYCVGLLCARRVLQKFKIGEYFQGNSDNLGEFIFQEDSEHGRPFKAILDIGLRRASKGARVFAVMKGAIDGGINVPANEKRLPGYNSETNTLDTEKLRSYIYGEKVAEYMKLLYDENQEKYKKQFSDYIKFGITPEKITEIYQNAHKLIREDPSPSLINNENKQKIIEYSKSLKKPRITHEQRKIKIREKLEIAAK